MLQAESLHAGTLPLWTALMYTGYPRFAEGQGGFLYPPNWLLFGLLPVSVWSAYHLNLLLHVLWAVAGAYGLGRALKLSRAGALVAAASFGLGGTILLYLGYTPQLTATAWLPWILWATERALASGRWWSLAHLAAVLAFALQCLAGHLQVPLYTGLALAGWVALYAVYPSPEPLPRRVGRAALTVATVGLAGAGVAAAQLWPAFELVGYTARAEGLSLAQATVYSVPPTGLGGLPFGRTDVGGEAYAYVGLLPLTLAATAAPWRPWRQRPVLAALSLAGVGLLLALGDATPAFEWLYRLPGFGSVRFPARFLTFVTFGLALLAGFGLDLARREPKARRLALAVGGALALGTALGWLAVGAPDLAAEWNGKGRPGLLQLGLLLIGLGALAGYGPHPPTRERPSPPGPLSRGVRAFRAALPTAALALLLATVLVDLAWHQETLNPTAPAAVLTARPSTVDFLRRDPSLYRVYSWDVTDYAAELARRSPDPDQTAYRDFSQTLKPNLPVAWGVQSLNGYTSLYLQRTQDYVATWTDNAWGVDPTNDLSPNGRPFDRTALAYFLPLLSALNVKYVITSAPLQDERLRPVFQDGVTIYENLTAQPRAYVVHDAWVGPPAAALAHLRSPEFDPTQTAILETPPAGWTPVAPPPTPGQARVLSYADERVEIETTSAADGFLVLADTDYPGWQATLDGQPVPILRANRLVRAVRLPAGTHRVVFRYAPESWRNGLLLSAATLLGLAAVTTWALWRARPAR